MLTVNNNVYIIVIYVVITVNYLNALYYIDHWYIVVTMAMRRQIIVIIITV